MSEIKMFVKLPTAPTAEEVEKFREESRKALFELKNFDDSKIIYDEDSPRLTSDQLDKMKRVYLKNDVRSYA